MPISEIQARLFFDSLTGNTKLPKKQEIRYVKSPRHTIQVDYGVYMEEIGEVLGCVPNIFKLMFTDPVLAWSLWTGPATAYTYRLTGPFPWDGARKAILETKDRIFAGMAPDGKYIKQKND
uniref:Flavin-containing monooxygenase n=1 Tax=Panagrolaimus sp. PS1159 TaxID=55785 RepID=A0AC35GGD3_9BILA